MAFLAFSFYSVPSGKLNSVKNYIYYRGEKFDKKLKNYDLVIVPPDFKRKFVKKLHRYGKKVIVSVKKEDNFAPYHILESEKPEENFDGFFIILQPSDTDFVRMLSDTFPDKAIIISTDVIHIEPFLDYIDGYMWRFFSTEFKNVRYMVKTDVDEIQRENYLAINILNRLRKYRKNFKVFSLDVLTIPDTQSIVACYYRARRLDFLEYVGTPALNFVIYIPDTFHVDSAYAYNSFDPVFKLPSQIVRDTSPENIALAMNGAEAYSDSKASWADISVVNDGYINDPAIEWLIPVNWASGSDSAAHYVEIRFADEYYLDSVKIYWPIVNGVPLSPKRYRLEAWSSERQFWWPMVIATDSRPRKMDRFVFTDAYAGRIRIYIAPGDGPKMYPFQLWVSEIKAYGE